ncbi:MAG TPA: hypothetical protein VFA33_22365 [Bryobacteraceae bacterium]|nr:hypothetical protein [Bryobacteraceae bacterium]
MMKYDAHDTPVTQIQDPLGRTAGEAAGPRPAVFLNPAPLVDVLIEQVEYLVGHLSRACPPRCPDCARLERAMVYLLKPFR